MAYYYNPFTNRLDYYVRVLVSFLLQETGDYLLLETGDKIII